MDEVYTCICKGQAWTIHAGFIRCENCNREFDSYCLRSPKQFNLNKESLEK